MKFAANLIFTALILIGGILLNNSALGQTTPQEMVDVFFKDFEEKGASKAIDNLYTTNKWMERASDAISNLKGQLEGFTEDYIGKYHGYEPITTKKLSESYILSSYLVKYDRQPIRFTFQFYKPNDKWKIQSFTYDGEVNDEIEEAAKVYYLDLAE